MNSDREDPKRIQIEAPSFKAGFGWSMGQGCAYLIGTILFLLFLGFLYIILPAMAELFLLGH